LKMNNMGVAPLWDGLMQFAKQEPASYHVPGHRHGQLYRQYIHETGLLKQGDVIDALAELARIDVTELSVTDDLHEPAGMIKEAQQKAATYFGADHTFFLVGGSTSGNLAIILSSCNVGDLIIVQRNVHKSIINGCKLAGVEVVFLSPDVEQMTGLMTVPSFSTLEAALHQYTEAKAVILTNPNYYGLSVKLEHYIELIHSYNIPVIVDEAHGAHYGLHTSLPQSALQVGADAVVQSTHKTLPALTMAAMLHIKGSRINLDRLQHNLAMLESSSPSYVLMASLDLARALMEHKGKEWIEQALQLIEELINWINKADLCIKLQQIDKSEQDLDQDPFRLLIYDSTTRMDGFELQREFEKYNIWVEMATTQYAVLVIHLSITEKDITQLKETILKITKSIEQKCYFNGHHSPSNRIHYINEATQISLPMKMERYKQYGSKKTILLDAAIGAKSAEMIVPYPPGIPILFEGETITASICEQIKVLTQLGARFQGNTTIEVGEIEVFMND